MYPRAFFLTAAFTAYETQLVLKQESESTANISKLTLSLTSRSRDVVQLFDDSSSNNGFPQF